MEEVVICTLEPEKVSLANFCAYEECLCSHRGQTYQQPIDITIPEDQPTFFKVSGTHAIHLTGNYVIPADDSNNNRIGARGEYDLSPDEDELELDDEDESDELDDLEDPRITEVESEDEQKAPLLVKKEKVEEKPVTKGKNKRPAEDAEEETKGVAGLDDIMAKSLKAEESKVNGEQKLSKKQLKKLKNNAGKAVETVVENKNTKQDNSNKGDKKVQFATNLEQAPSSSASTLKPETNGESKVP